jgi:DNA-binding GntR family transcriptional regulator
MENLIVKNQKKSLSEMAYLSIKESIINGRLKPGEELNECNIAEELSISRTPLRSALNRLHAEGLVRITPNKGCAVRKLDLKEIVEITQVREALEGMVARLACDRISKKELNEVISWFPSFDRELNETDFAASYDAGIKMHNYLREKSNNHIIQKQLAFIDMQIKLVAQMSTEVPGRSELAHKEHKEIIDALVAKDPELAEEKMRSHIRNVRMSFML